MVNKKLQVWLPLLFAVVMIIGMFFGYRLNGGNTKFFKAPGNNSLQEALDLIHSKYVDKTNGDSLERLAIADLINGLDPHSVYFPPAELKEVNEELAGNFDGIGIEFNIFDDTVNVVYVLPGGPSDKAGLLIGDKIIRANDTMISGPDVPLSKIREAIRGEKGSVARISLLRNGEAKNINVTRGSIPLYSLDPAYMADSSTAYIKINKFTESTYEEFMKAMEDLLKNKPAALVLDLRGNGGGLMNEAIDIADEFLDGDKLIVYTEGANSKKREYKCHRPGLFEKGKLAVLIDELSASASEVLAGALQDWDRATIIGRRSFGKGLVQEQYELSNGGAIRLTVAKYYTPVGRSIQRPYQAGKKDYMDELYDRYNNGQLLVADSNKTTGRAYKTPAGHTVYGGGGIMPDVFVPVDTTAYPLAITHLFVDGSIDRFTYQYYLQHRHLLDNYKSPAEFNHRFDQQQQLWQQFFRSVQRDSLRLDTVILSAAQKQRLQQRLAAYLGRYRWRSNGFYQVLNEGDAMIAKAKEVFRK